MTTKLALAWLSRIGGGPFVVVSNDIDDDGVDAVLASPVVAAVIGRLPRSAQLDPDRCADLSAHALPRRVAREVFFLGDPAQHTISLLARLLAAGARAAVWPLPEGGIARRPLWELTCERGLASSRLALRSALVRSAPLGSALVSRGEQERAALIADALARLPVPARDASAATSIVIATSSLRMGGSERQAVNLACGLQAQGRETSLVVHGRAADGDPSLLADLRSAGVPVADLLAPPEPRERVDNEAAFIRAALAAEPWFATLVTAWTVHLRRARPGTLQAFLDEPNVAAGVGAVLAGVPRVVLSGRSLAPTHFDVYRPWQRPGYRWLLRQPGVVLANNSNAGARSYAEWLGISPSDVVVIPNGSRPLPAVDPARSAALRARVARGAHDRLVGTIARLGDGKDPDVFVAVAAEVVRRVPGVRFVWFGGGPRPARRAARHVVFAGPTTKREEALGALDVFLLTSRAEGLPNVLIEAAQTGLPIVTTDAGGAREAVEPGVNALVCPVGAVEELTGAVVRALTDDAFIASARARGPTIAAERFSVDAMVASYQALYDSHSRHQA
ncbi:MAG: glycosyltransferase [Deltaproteobacteria bacterium]|nr:glycosyltransferase [Deltaproteobacteria bacterium]